MTNWLYIPNNLIIVYIILYCTDELELELLQWFTIEM